MPCEPVDLGNGVRAIVCGPRGRHGSSELDDILADIKSTGTPSLVLPQPQGSGPERATDGAAVVGRGGMAKRGASSPTVFPDDSDQGGHS